MRPSRSLSIRACIVVASLSGAAPTGSAATIFDSVVSQGTGGVGVAVPIGYLIQLSDITQHVTAVQFNNYEFSAFFNGDLIVSLYHSSGGTLPQPTELVVTSGPQHLELPSGFSGLIDIPLPPTLLDTSELWMVVQGIPAFEHADNTFVVKTHFLPPSIGTAVGFNTYFTDGVWTSYESGGNIGQFRILTPGPSTAAFFLMLMCGSSRRRKR